jgi:hypothetical protein
VGAAVLGFDEPRGFARGGFVDVGTCNRGTLTRREQ